LSLDADQRELIAANLVSSGIAVDDAGTVGVESGIAGGLRQ
jgi:hypothetical protein